MTACLCFADRTVWLAYTALIVSVPSSLPLWDSCGFLERAYITLAFPAAELAPRVLFLAMPGLSERLPFVPLLAYSSVCAVGLHWCWWLAYKLCRDAADDQQGALAIPKAPAKRE